MALEQAVAGLGVTTRVLLIAAHPDDEDSRLIAWLARGRHVETAYLSLTRGDGGQNLIGNELGDALGVIRTEELLAARRIDGAHQYFGREYDFGFSKTAAETFTHWPHDSVLGDVVTVVRAFRPQVIIAVFTGTPQDGHGHHQVSGIVAREAYDLSGDTVRFPAAIYGPAWTASKFYRDRSYFGGGDSTLAINDGAYDPLLGESYGEIAAQSRSQHKSQGFGQVARMGPYTGYLYREASRVNAGSPKIAERSMFDGIDTTFGRLKPFISDAQGRAQLDSLGPSIARLHAHLDVKAPDSTLGPLADLARQLHALDSRYLPFGRDTTRHADPDLIRTIHIAQDRVNDAIILASGVTVQASVEHDLVPIDLPAPATVTLYNRGRLPVSIGGVNFGTATQKTFLDLVARPTPPDSAQQMQGEVSDTAVTQPWWLVRPRHGDLFNVPQASLRRAEDERAVAWAEDEVSRRTARGDTVYFTPRVPIVQRTADPVRGEVDRPIAFVRPVSLTFDHTVEYVPAGSAIDRTERLLLRSGVGDVQQVAVALMLPKGLRADSAARHVTLPAYGVLRVQFRVRGTLPPGDAALSASATVNGRAYTDGYIPIEYDHIRPQKLYRDAAVQLHAVDVKVPAGLTVAYIPGVGDNVAPTLQSLGLPVAVLDTASLATIDLSKFSAVVVGPRAYQASPDVVAASRRLLEYVKNGGTLVVQYGQNEMTTDGLMPFPITMSRPADRVTDELAPVTVLDPAAPVLNVPNKITAADWDGWVQERSLYMPRTFDPRYKAVVSMHDPGEPANAGGILIAPYGKGTYVYTTLSFFRQLPAGNPGAARLFVNLLAAGRAPAVARVVQ